MGVEQYLHRAEIADIDEVKEAVVELCLGGDQHAATEIPGIGNAEIDRIQIAFLTIVNADADGRVFEAEYFLQRREGEARLSAQALDGQPVGGRTGFDPLDYRRGQTDGRNI